MYGYQAGEGGIGWIGRLAYIHYSHCCLGTKLGPIFLWSQGLQPTRLLGPWDFPGKNTGMGWQFLLQGLFPTQGLNLRLLHDKQILYHWAIREACTLWYYEITNENLLCSRGTLLSAMWWPKWKEVQKRGDIYTHTYILLIHLAVQ